MSADLRLGIIGCGRVAEERHLPALRQVQDVRVTAVADTDGERAERLAGRLGGVYGCTDYRALLERNDVDAVAVLTPTPSHAEIVLAALDAEKHVLVEKPLAVSTEDCGRIVARAALSTVKVVLAFNLRQHRLVRKARARVQSGELGRIRLIRSIYTHDRTGKSAPAWHRELRLGGGVILNEAIHHFDLWRFLLGSEVEEIVCAAQPSDLYEHESSTISAKLSDGALASGAFSLSTSPQNELEICGEKGRLLLSCYRFDGLAVYPHEAYPGDWRHRLRETAASFAQFGQAIPSLRRGGDFQDSFRSLWRHFADCIRDDRQPDCSLLDGQRAVQIAIAAAQSARSGQSVRPVDVK